MDQIVKFVFILLAVYVLYSVCSTKETNNYYYTTTKECYRGQGMGTNNDVWACNNGVLSTVSRVRVPRTISITRNDNSGSFPEGLMQVGVKDIEYPDGVYYNDLEKSGAGYNGNIPYSYVYKGREVYLKFVPANTKSSYSLCDDLKNLNIVIE